MLLPVSQAAWYLEGDAKTVRGSAAADALLMCDTLTAVRHSGVTAWMQTPYTFLQLRLAWQCYKHSSLQENHAAHFTFTDGGVGWAGGKREGGGG